MGPLYSRVYALCYTGGAGGKIMAERYILTVEGPGDDPEAVARFLYMTFEEQSREGLLEELSAGPVQLTEGMEQPIAEFLALHLRARGAEVRLKPVARPLAAEPISPAPKLESRAKAQVPQGQARSAAAAPPPPADEPPPEPPKVEAPELGSAAAPWETEQPAEEKEKKRFGGFIKGLLKR